MAYIRLSTLATWYKEPIHWKRPWFWERLKAGEGDHRGWDDWMASLTQWTQVSPNSGRWWRTGKPGMLQSIGLQRVRQDLVTEQQQQIVLIFTYFYNNYDLFNSFLKYNSTLLFPKQTAWWQTLNDNKINWMMSNSNFFAVQILTDRIINWIMSNSKTLYLILNSNHNSKQSPVYFV